MTAVLDTFGWPLALFALLLVPVAVLFARLEVRRRRSAQVALGGPQVTHARRHLGSVAQATLFVVAITLAVLAFARPRWGSEEIPLEQRGIDVVVVLDISRSMLAQDVLPSRAQASSAAVGELLTHLQGNRVGLVTFAGSSFARSPLTLDTEAVRTLVRRAQDESSLVRPGSDIGGAVSAGLALLDVKDRATTQVIVLVTDGEVQQGDITAVGAVAAKARSQGIRVYGVYAASDEPTALPIASGGTDVTRGQRTPLNALAEQTGAQVRDVGQAAGYAVEFRRLQQTRFAEASREARVERFQWFAGASLALLVVQSLLPTAASSSLVRRRSQFRHRRGLRSATLTSLLAVSLLLSGCTTLLGTAVYRAVNEGNRLYREGKYEEALAAYDRAAAADAKSAAIVYNRGLALHRLTRYDESYRTTLAAVNEATDPAMAEKMEYSAGNSAMLLEQWANARARYVAALRLDPNDAAAKANLELALTRSGRSPNGTPSNDGQDPQQNNNPGDRNQQGNDGQGAQQPGQQPGQQGQQTQAGSSQSGQTQPGQSGQPGQPSSANGDGDTVAPTAAEAQAALEAALGALGPEVTREQALRILELARQANALKRATAPVAPNGPPPPR